MGKTLYYAEFHKPNFSVKRMFANMEFLIKVVQYGKFKRKMVRCVTASTMRWNPLWRSDVIFFICNFKRSKESQVSAVSISLLPQTCSKQGKLSNLCFQKDFSLDLTSLFFIKSVQIVSKPGQKSGKSGLKEPVNFQWWILKSCWNHPLIKNYYYTRLVNFLTLAS